MTTRREFLRRSGTAVSGAALLALDPALSGVESLGASGGGRAPSGRRVIVLGFDGMSPVLAERWMAEGKLPHLAALRAQGGFGPLQTTNPAQTPVSWSSFATGMNPGKTRIFDFLKRDPQSYYPDFSMVSIKKAKYVLDLLPLSKPKVTNNRGGTSVWAITSRAGISTHIIHPPVAFPPEPVNGALLSGLGVPDIRGTIGTYSFYTTEAPSAADTEFGGKIVPVAVRNGVIRTVVHGPRSPVHDTSVDVTIPLTLRLAKNAVTIDLQGQRETVAAGQWSRWFEMTFDITPLVSIRGIGRFHVNALAPEVQIYLSPVNFHPAHPPLAVSYPKAFAAKLVETLGYYKTLGWATDTWAFNERRLSPDVFLEDLFFTLDQEEKILRQMLARKGSFLAHVIMETDRVSHMFWRLIDPGHPAYDAEEARKHGDAIERVYRRADEIVGLAMAACDADTDLLVISDHGFNTFRHAVNINTWLARNGFLALTDSAGAVRERNLDDLFGRGQFWPNVDWSRSTAYALGLGQIYVNLRGRESQGVVTPGDEYEDVRARIVEGLGALRDPHHAGPVFRRIYRREEIYSGDHFGEMPDLVVGLESGYRVSWQTSLGGIPKDVIEPNDRFWSADHCSVDPEITAGCIFTNQRGLSLRGASMIDLAPTILARLGLPVPRDMDGKALV